MKLLLDESIPKRLIASFPAEFEVFTVQQSGWSGTSNGSLLKLASENSFDALITADRGFEYQQNKISLPLTVVILNLIPYLQSGYRVQVIGLYGEFTTERNPHCDCRKREYRYTNQSFVPCAAMKVRIQVTVSTDQACGISPVGSPGSRPTQTECRNRCV